MWLRVDSTQFFRQQPLVKAERYLLDLNRQTAPRAAELKRQLGAGARKVAWCLPPVVYDSQWGRLRKQVQLLIRSGFRLFQVAHLSQLALLAGERVSLAGDYTLNVLNSQALRWLRQLSLSEVQLAVEGDRQALAATLDAARRVAPTLRLGLTVYGALPLFTARFGGPQPGAGRSLVSPKGERYQTGLRDGLVVVTPERPFSLLPFRDELADMGLDYLVLDLRGQRGGRREQEELAARLANKGRFSRLSTFNYGGRLE